MCPKPSPRPERELARVRVLADELADLEARVAAVRAQRNKAMLDARRAGATGQHLADAAGIDRRNVTEVLRSATPE
ncbi:hypothetical protein GCM10012275_54710 [Longimycelium tulufanense]|uniref:Uncharacterized protein n=1 Tax=Longimycelium tulufanense TaxID=907463 RepID=A0A8J3FYM7_9PSEU|nr:hypothetical protein GCM10012275_54710 [Longimycelium tulufanense]